MAFHGLWKTRVKKNRTRKTRTFCDLLGELAEANRQQRSSWIRQNWLMSCPTELIHQQIADSNMVLEWEERGMVWVPSFGEIVLKEN